MSIGPKPKTASPPKLPHVSLIRLRVKVLVMELVLIFRLFIAHKGVDSSALGMYLRILWTAWPKRMTGQRNRYLVLSWVLALNLSPFFWSSNTTVTNLALVSRLGNCVWCGFVFWIGNGCNLDRPSWSFLEQGFWRTHRLSWQRRKILLSGWRHVPWAHWVLHCLLGKNVL